MRSGRQYMPDRGHIIFINFDPQAGREQARRRPAIVLTPLPYNQKTGLIIVCPITSQVKGYPFEVPLLEGMKTVGVILADHIKSLDWNARNAVFIETAPDELLNEVRAKIEALIF